MGKTDNLASKLCSVLSLQNEKGDSNSAQEWRILGKENNGSILVSWITEDSNHKKFSHIGICTPQGPNSKRLKTLYKFQKQCNPIQATVNKNLTILGFVIKEPPSDDALYNELVYKPYLVEVTSENETAQEPYCFGIERCKQVMIQFLYKNNSTTYNKEKLLLLIHQESSSLYSLTFNEASPGKLTFDREHILSDSVCRSFSWAQWDPSLQALFYIHYKPAGGAVEGDIEPQKQTHLRPTLSALQFHDDLPHETVFNIPLNLPSCSVLPSSGIYEDDCIPLRVHDCSLDLLILADETTGKLCICHHYVYQPSNPQESQSDSSVHFAYSVTILHHGCVVHCVVPGLPWDRARTLRPTFAWHGDHHMLVLVPGLLTHLLDIGLTHAPCCHIVAGPCTVEVTSHLISLSDSLGLALDAATLDIIPLKVTQELLVEAFKKDISLENRAAILHYYLVHQYNLEVVVELLAIVMTQPLALGVPQLLQEILLGGAFSSVHRTLPQEADSLLHLLPVTTLNNKKPVQAKVSGMSVGVSHEVLYSSGVALLSPSQRLQPFSTDIWTRLWHLLDQQTQNKPRFQPSQVSEKLLVSLVCYQPEALSRCTTPLTPSGAPIGDLGRSHGGFNDTLPFLEMESCTASKQEHVISVNLRELSMHLVKQSAGRVRWQPHPGASVSGAGHVHAVATRYAAAQLELSRSLCLMLCQVAGLDDHRTFLKGFELIEQLSKQSRYELFVVLERYLQATEALAFPLPQGFASFFCLLGHRTLPFDTFLQYVRAHVFELQIDVMKHIMADTDDTQEGVRQKLRLLSLLPRSRARRLMANWSHPVSLMLRAREHAMQVLSGEPAGLVKQSLKPRGQQLGLAAFPSAERLSPLDTFLDLLTAKASLNELDFNLLIEATITSTEEFL